MTTPTQQDIQVALEIDCYCGCDDPMSSEPKCDTLQDAVCRPHRQMAQALADARAAERTRVIAELRAWAGQQPRVVSGFVRGLLAQLDAMAEGADDARL